VPENQNKNIGFTLIELIITLAIAAILMSLAAPSFQSTIRNNRTVTNANNLLASLNIARSEAIKRGTQVTLRRKGSTSQNWDNGWDIFTDLDGNGSLDDDGDTVLCENVEDCLLRTTSALTNNYTLRTNTPYGDWISYKSDGLVLASGGTAGTFRLCDNTANTATSRAIIISTTGRARIATGTTSCP